MRLEKVQQHMAELLVQKMSPGLKFSLSRYVYTTLNSQSGNIFASYTGVVRQHTINTSCEAESYSN